MITIGSSAPTFTLHDQGGIEHSLDQYRGAWVVLYAYPKDDTPGCTKQACAMQAALDEFERRNTILLGISADSQESHEKFAAKHNLSFPLLADETTETLQAYGVWQEKNIFGKKKMGIVRTTFIINPEGVVVHVFPKVSPEKNTLAVLQKLDALMQE